MLFTVFGLVVFKQIKTLLTEYGVYVQRVGYEIVCYRYSLN